jgi:hypothetical protein
MNEYNIMMGIIVFPIICIFTALCGGIIYLLYLPINARLIKTGKLSLQLNQQINIAYVVILYLLSIYQTYDAFFPGESFYENEYEQVTKRKIPSSANFISKAATYPDFHGDYCSASMINISQSDYKRLFNELKNDNKLKPTSMNESSELNQIMGKRVNDIIYCFQRDIPGEEDRYLYIGFLNDGETIVVEVCVT